MERVTQQINDLKKDIQYLINKKKESDDKEYLEKIENEKNNKMSSLKILNDKLKDLNNKNHEEYKNKLKAVGRSVDTLEYSKAKKKNSQDAMNKAKKNKEERDLVKNKYLEFLDNEKLYLEKDPKDLSCYIFLHHTILEIYGLCPYMEISDLTTEEIYNKRLEWLQSQTDNGKKYFELYNNIIKKEELNNLLNEKSVIENKIIDFIKNILSESQIEIFNNSILFLEEYMKCIIKTKKIKEKYKLFIHNLSILCSESKLPLHIFISKKFNLQIDVNEIKTDKVLEYDKTVLKYMIYEFEKFNDEYSKCIENIEAKEKYIMNTIKNLKNELYLFLTKQKSFNNNSILINKPKIINQVGKYYKRWIALTLEEKHERFESFAKYYINKNFVNDNDKDILLSSLTNLIIEAI